MKALLLIGMFTSLTLGLVCGVLMAHAPQQVEASKPPAVLGAELHVWMIPCKINKYGSLQRCRKYDRLIPVLPNFGPVQ